ncbi:MAG: carboxypeptidase-like regulatory domain-containing protein, partial [Rikenellaceae bacterium]
MKEQLQLSRLLLLLLFLFSSVLQVRANGIVLTTRDLQEKSVTLKMTDATINEILSEIKKQTNLNFIYKDAELKSFGKKTISLSNVTVEKALNEILSDKNLSYKIEGNSISIFKKSAPTAQDNTKPVKIEGKVLDGKTKKPIVGATVILKNSPNGAITDDAGKFTLNCKIGQEIEVSFVGMKPLTLKISKASADMIIEMENDALNVEDVVVTGIYTRKSDSFTGSAVSFKAKDLKAVGGSNVLQSLKSLDPSFTITENNNYGSDPNRMPDIEIRGKSSVVGLKEEYATDPNQPLFILDGFETTLKTVVDLNMDRVASVTILKDAASTAIYGSKAANGV